MKPKTPKPPVAPKPPSGQTTPVDDDAAAAGADADPGHEAGRLQLDDRGNVTWQWREDVADLQADDELGTVERLRALVDPKLEVKDDDPPSTLQHNPKGLKTGYNPYNSGTLGKRTWKKKKDLRRLSEWIRLKKKLEQDPNRG